MTPAPDAGRQDRALDPVRAQLIRRAEQDADALVAAARGDAAAAVESARAQARTLLDEARTQGEELARAESAEELSQALRRSRTLELAAERAVYDELCEKVARGLSALRDAPEYPAVRTALESRARALLGPRADIAEHERGGIVARAPGRRVDLSLPAIAARALDRLGQEVEQLWAP